MNSSRLTSEATSSTSAVGGGGAEQPGAWLHEWLCDRSERCVGIDIDDAAVATAQKHGYDVRQGNVETVALDEMFDLVVATNIIEHLTCPGAMLDTASGHLRDRGRLILTTPRTFVPWTLARQLKGGIEPPEEHVMWFCRDTLTSMLARHDFRVVNYQSWGWRRVGTVWYEKLFHAVENALALLPGLQEITDYQHFVVAKTEG